MRKVLVLGAARSGVSAITRAVAAGTGCEARNVADRLGALHAMSQAALAHAAAHARACGDAAPVQALPSAVLAAFADVLCGDEKAADPGGLRLLHAPDLLPACPNLKAAFLLLHHDPTAAAIVVWRHGVDFVNSCVRAVPRTDFASHCLCWTAAVTQMRRLVDEFGDRVLIICHGELLEDGPAVAARLAGFLRLEAEKAHAVARSLAEPPAGRTAALLHDPVLELARTGWAMPEIELFWSICHGAAEAAGIPLRRLAAERTRPLNLALDLIQRGRAFGGLTAAEAGARNAGSALLTNAGTGDTGGAGLRLGPLTAGRRNKLRLQMSTDESELASELRVELVEALSGRPVFARMISLEPKGKVRINEALPQHDGLLDFRLSLAPAQAGHRFQATFEASLSRA